MTVAAPRKARTRKVAARKVSTPVKVTAKVRKVSKPAPLAVKRPAASRLISPQRYLQDIKARWSIHNYEIAMLLDDLVKVNTYVRQLTK